MIYTNWISCLSQALRISIIASFAFSLFTTDADPCSVPRVAPILFGLAISHLLLRYLLLAVRPE